jgi:hypothetical protein
MSNKHRSISDQLLAKFLDGKTNAFETAQVLNYLNENKENLEDFKNIRSATRMGPEYPLEIDLVKCSDFVKQHIESSSFVKKTNRRKFYLLFSLSLAAMITGMIFIFFFKSPDKDNLTIIANEQNFQKDSLLFLVHHLAPYEQIIDSLREQISSINQNDFYDKLVDNKSTNKKEFIEIYEEKKPEIKTQIQYKNTASQSEANIFEMIKPVKPSNVPYVILCKNLEKTFNFKWNTNAEKTEIVLKDKHGNILLTNDIAQDGFSFKCADYIKYGKIYWEIKATFTDEETDVKRGILQLMQEE